VAKHEVVEEPKKLEEKGPPSTSYETESLTDHDQPTTNKPAPVPFNSILEQFDKYTPTVPSAQAKPAAEVVHKKPDLVSPTSSEMNFYVPSSLSSDLLDVDHKILQGFNLIHCNKIYYNRLMKLLLLVVIY
jgi:hypothetical protein